MALVASGFVSLKEIEKFCVQWGIVWHVKRWPTIEQKREEFFDRMP